MTQRDEITVAPASAADAAEIATLYLASRAAALPYLRRVHSDADTRRWIETVMLTRGESWVARIDGTILGFVTIEGENLEQLYLRPGQERRGIGSRLLAQAKARSPGHLRLYTFQRNSAARAFYEARGFRIVAMSDGSRNEEGEPDILYEWRGDVFAS